MALPNARNQYLKTQIETASREQLVVMLFDGIIRFTDQARKAIEEKNIEDSHHALMRAQAIIMELLCTINKEKGGDLAKNLMSLHAYAFNCLIKCNMSKEASYIDEVQKIYRELRTAWVTAMDSAGISATKPAGEKDAPQPTPPRGGPGAPISTAPATVSTVGIPAANAPAPAPGVIASAAPVAPAAAPQLGNYGMGRTAMMAGMSKPAAAPAQKQNVNAMLNAYGAGSRSA